MARGASNLEIGVKRKLEADEPVSVTTKIMEIVETSSEEEFDVKEFAGAVVSSDADVEVIISDDEEFPIFQVLTLSSTSGRTP